MAGIYYRAAAMNFLRTTAKALWSPFDDDTPLLLWVVGAAAAGLIDFNRSCIRDFERRMIVSLSWVMAVLVGVPLATVMLSYNRNAAIIETCFLSANESTFIIEQVQSETNRTGWTTSRHRYHPTQDIPVSDLSTLSPLINELVRARVLPLITDMYQDEPYIRDMFIVKYDTLKQARLEPHVDGGHVSFNALLSPHSSFRGGGHRFLNTCIARCSSTARSFDSFFTAYRYPFRKPRTDIKPSARCPPPPPSSPPSCTSSSCTPIHCTSSSNRTLLSDC
jgi:hypothetical protein